jgi:glutamate N-acetyltransferase/amino-acid N-acetyltransferase
MRNARELVGAVAGRLGCDANELVIASTGVIGRQYPMDRIRRGIEALPATLLGTDADLVARAIMTTDTRPKTAEASVRGSSARVVGVAKGVGMIEPDMATHISLIFTDASLSRGELETAFRHAVEHTFNRVSIDTDTSTSDTTVCLASGAAGAVDRTAFADALHEVLLSLTKQIARDGEGAERIIEVRVDQARGARRRPKLGSRRHGRRQVQPVRRHPCGARHHSIRRAGSVPEPGRRFRSCSAQQLHA